MQRPDATYVAGFRAFLELNRCVRKGERAIRILAPMSVRARESETARRGYRRRRRAAEADRLPRGRPSSTSPRPTRCPARSRSALHPPSEPIEGDTHAHLLAPLAMLAGELGYTVSVRAARGARRRLV